MASKTRIEDTRGKIDFSQSEEPTLNSEQTKTGWFFIDWLVKGVNWLKTELGKKADDSQSIDYDLSAEPAETGTKSKTANVLWQNLFNHTNFLWLKLKELFPTTQATTHNYLPKIDNTLKKLVKSNIQDDGNRVQIDSPLRVNSKTYYNVAQYNGTVSQTGIIKITAPVSWNNSLCIYEIDILSYRANRTAKLIISGDDSTSGQWIYPSATILGNLPDKTIRLGYDGSKFCILIGTTSTVWNNLHVFLSKISQSVYSTTDLSNGWNISVITDETGIANIVTPQVNAGFEADLLDGKHASEFIIPADLETNKLYPPTLTTSWLILNSDDEPSGITKTTSAITLEYGYKPSVTAVQAKWTQPSGYDTPESCDGLCGSNLPAINTLTSPAANILYNTFAPTSPTDYYKSVIVWNIYADKKGITVSGNRLIMPEGDVSANASLSVTYQLPIYYGVVTVNSMTETIIKSLPSPIMKNCRSLSREFSPKINALDTQYWVYAYPSAWGVLTNISNADGDWSAAFTTGLINIESSNTLLTTEYRYYITVNRGAFKNKIINFS